MSTLSGERVTVQSISGNTVTLTAGLVNTYAVGDIAAWAKFAIPTGKLLFVGQANGPWENLGANGPPDGDLVNAPIAIASTYSRHVDLEPRSGMFVKMIDKRANEDVARVEMVCGISAMAEVHYVESWFTADYL